MKFSVPHDGVLSCLRANLKCSTGSGNDGRRMDGVSLSSNENGQTADAATAVQSLLEARIGCAPSFVDRLLVLSDFIFLLCGLAYSSTVGA